jgi:hypothetical protein
MKPFSTVHNFIVERYLRKKSCKAVKQVKFPDASVANKLRKSTAPLSAEFLMNVLKRVELSVHNSVGDISKCDKIV